MKSILKLLFLVSLMIFAAGPTLAAKVDPELSSKILQARPADRLEVIITYTQMPTDGDVSVLYNIGITTGIRYRMLPMIAVLATPGQVQSIARLSNVRSVWGNAKYHYYTNHTRPLIGLQRLQTNAAITRRNGGLPISGKGVGIAIVDSGVDGTHPDLSFAPFSATSKVRQNVKLEGRPLSDGTGSGIIPNVYVENVITTDNTSGHGTYVASCAAGSGAASGGVYGGVAPGAHIIGLGAGETLAITVDLVAFDYILTHQFDYNIRIVNNSWGGNVALDPDNPTNVAMKIMHDNFIAVVFAAGNDGPGPETLSIWARSPYAIGVGAGTKDGRLANFSSRGFAGGSPGPGAPTGEPPAPQNFGPSVVAPGAAMVNARMRAGVNIIGALGAEGNSDDGTGFFPKDVDPENPSYSIPPAFLASYTYSSGTSFAAPSYCGALALALEADPTLLPDDLKQLFEETATAMPGYAPWEVGAGYINVAAAVDRAMNRNKPYGTFNNRNLRFNAAFTTESDSASYHFDFSPASPPGTYTKQFTVRQGASSVLATMDYRGDPATASNTLILNLFDPTGERFDTVVLPGLTANHVVLEVRDPRPGNWRLEVSGFTPLGVDNNLGSVPDTIDGQINVIFPTGSNVTDIGGRDDRGEIERALIRRLMDSFADNSFRPNQGVTREDLGRTLILCADIRQNLLDSPQFADVSAEFSPMASALAARGSAMKDTFQRYAGVMARGASGANFFPAAAVSRADLAVALVRALGLEQQAQARMSENLSARAIDAAQIPADARGFVAVALDLGLLSTFPAEVKEVAPGVFQAIPGPRFEPATIVKRADLAKAVNRFADNFNTSPATIR
ncbi:MAG: S8 family serine peptidase [Blastocatellia bacterium]